MTLIVCPDARGRAAGVLYEDAGEGMGYRSGDYRVTEYEARRQGAALRIRISRGSGKRPEAERAVQIRVVLDQQELVAYGREGDEIEVTMPITR